MVKPAIPVLFVHAFPFDSRMWQAQIDAVAGSRVVLAPDLRGFGRNRTDPYPTSIEQHARDLLAILDRSSAPRAFVVGLSMGGYIALALQRIASARVAGLMLCDTKAAADTPEARRGRDARIERIGREGMGFLPDDMLASLVAPHCADPVKLEARRIILEQDPRGVQCALMALRDRPDSTSILSSIRVPTSVVCGEHDALTPPSVMQAMAAQIPGATYVILPHAGHLACLENPAAFNAALSEALHRA